MSLNNSPFQLFWSNIFLSMASLVIIMQLRYLGHALQRKFKRHRNYLWVLNHMERSYPLATQDDLNHNSDNCAICWEKMDQARKLPCGHIFHTSCLQSWLEQDTSCPTCRLALSVQTNVPTPNIVEPEPPPARTNNHFFRFNGQSIEEELNWMDLIHLLHFSGSRYVSWFPNFSVEVTHINNLLRADVVPATTLVTHTSQIRSMARQVQQMFPRYPMSVIIADLQITRSLELTVDNILEGRLVPAHFQGGDDELDDDVDATASTPTSTNSDSSGSSIEIREDTNPASDYYIDPQFPDSSNSSTASRESPTTGYEIERNSNIFGNPSSLLMESTEDVSLGDRFSKSSMEREKILARRKELLLAQARKRFLHKNESWKDDSGAASSSSSAEDGLRYRSKTSISE